MIDSHEDTPPSSSPLQPQRRGGGPFRWLWLYARGLVLDQHLRRMTMFYVVISTMVMVFVGAVFVFDWKEHPMRFVVYWLVVIWLTISVTLLTAYDLLLLRLQHRVLRRQLRERMLGRDFDEYGSGNAESGRREHENE